MTNLEYEQKVIREAAELTTGYVSSTVRWIEDNLDLTGKNQLILLLELKLSSLTSVELKAEFSNDNVTYYQETSLDISGGTWTVNLFEYTFTLWGNYRLAIPIKDKYVKISAKWTGTVWGSELKITSITWQS